MQNLPQLITSDLCEHGKLNIKMVMMTRGFVSKQKFGSKYRNPTPQKANSPLQNGYLNQ